MLNYGNTRIVVCRDERDLGARAAGDVAEIMRGLLENQAEVKLIFAAGESQNTFLAALSVERGLDWQRTTCFNMDDFWDPRMPEPLTCGHQTRTQLYDRVYPRQFHLVRFDAPDPHVEAERFAALLSSARPIDILCQGIGTSGHLALNEPGGTDFHDEALVRVVDLAEQSKRQLREDPNFRGLGYIPAQGITMTIPAMLAAHHVFTIVPLALKREILTRLIGIREPTVDLPASILYRTPGVLYVDRNSCPEALLKEE